MKKLLGIVVFGFLFISNVNTSFIKAEAADYLFKDNVFADCDVISNKDPSSLENILFVKEKKIKFWDRRKQTSSGWNQSVFKAFVFKVTYEKGKDISIRVNSEFKTKDKAAVQALIYGGIAGQLPNFLRKNLKTITIHKGNEAWGGGNYDILIHTDSYKGNISKCVEEIMLHEAGHTSLDPAWRGSVKVNPWKKAAKKDGKFISKYAEQFPDREDIAETINWWTAVRCKPDRISKSNYNKVIEGIPNRLKNLDEENYDTYPMVCR